MTASALIAIAALAPCGPRHAATGAGPGPGPSTGTSAEATPDAGVATATGSTHAPIPWETAGIDWTRPPAPGAEPAWAPPVPTRFTLASGAQVLLVENHRLPLVSVRIVLTRAGAREDGDHAGLALLTADLLDEGAGKRDALALSEEIERLGASLDVAVGADATTIWLDTLASTFADSVAVLGSMLTRPTFAKADFARVRGDQLAQLALRPQAPRRVAALVFEELVFGDHPYGQPVSGFPATVEALTLAQVKAFWKRNYTAPTATIIVTGDVTRAQVERVLRKGLAGWKGKAPAAATPVAPPPLRTPVVWFVDRPDAPQSVVMIGRVGPGTDDADFHTAEVINTAVGGSFAARLNQRLREQLGYTYAMYAAFWRGRWGGTWAITSSLKTANTVDGIREALAIVAAARAEALPAAELAKAQQLMTRQLPQDLETNNAIAGQLSTLAVKGLPFDWLSGYVAAIQDVTAARARELADAAWGDVSIVVVGDWAVVGAGLAGLGLPIVHVDADGRPLADRP